MALADTVERCGLLYDHTKKIYTSMLTQTDFLAMLYYGVVSEHSNLHTKPLHWWMQTREDERRKKHLPVESKIVTAASMERYDVHLMSLIL
jgi:hypothetical protein